ncbi:hypothetical protein L1987_60665 [Smallanthus sonchifolius]|uniref:Uncharacterized protein n=1 Tax=Smallanthus sonchifolius TaxID=185202 RepID=A0ACB9D8X7_9ASTR|nr:hypothetical protein L1987_60665 [Smallanthus sonchifolius]
MNSDQPWILEASTFVTLILIVVHVLALVERSVLVAEPYIFVPVNCKDQFELYKLHFELFKVHDTFGDSVLMRSSENKKAPYVARIEGIEADVKGNAKVRVRWYYRREESMGGRRKFHGIKELFLSDHYDTQSAHTIEDKCIVHTFRNYTKLEIVGPKDYFCRFEYKAATGGFTPDLVSVYCKYEMPKNPDDLMVKCEACKDWYHPACLNMTIEQAKQLDSFMCYECSSLDTKRPQNRSSASALANGKNSFGPNMVVPLSRFVDHGVDSSLGALGSCSLWHLLLADLIVGWC